MKTSKIILFTFFTFLLTVNARAQLTNYSSLKKNLHSYLEVIQANKGFSGEILVGQGEQIVFQEAIGFSSVEHNLTMEIGVNYQIASITKTFTGTLIAFAHREHKLNVTDKVAEHINGLSDAFKDITIYQLLTHTSGLPHNEGIEDYWQIKSHLQLNTEQIIVEINNVDLLFAPGSKTHYSSLGYYLLATILETVYEDNFQDILVKKILTPLHMVKTGSVNSLNIIPGMSLGYHLVTDDSLVVAPHRNYSILKGAGDMHATSTDLLKWTNSFIYNTLPNEETKAMIFGPDGGYSFGWFIKAEKPTKYYHGGGTWGYSSYIAIYPARKISIILLSNVSALPVESMAEDIEKIVFGLPFEMPTVAKPIARDVLDLKIYGGTFISESNAMKLYISNTDNGLSAQLDGKPAFEIYPKGNDQFFGRKVEIEFTFKIRNNVVTGLKAERLGQIFHFKKL